VPFGSVDGVRCIGRQPNRWFDTVIEWTGLNMSDAVKLSKIAIVEDSNPS